MSNELVEFHRRMRARHRHADPAVLRRAGGKDEIWGFQKLCALGFVDSKQMTLLRAADSLLAASSEFCRSALDDGAISQVCSQRKYELSRRNSELSPGSR